MIGIVRGIVDQFNLRAVHAKPVVAARLRAVEAQSLDYVDLLVPGILAMAIAQSAAFGVPSRSSPGARRACCGGCA